jgi:tRNA G10  N-methylase Trm11
MKEYLVRFAQVHETFRKPELFALAELAGVELEIVDYQEEVSAHIHSIMSIPPVTRISTPSHVFMKRIVSLSNH